MNLEIFCFFDSKSGIFHPPFFMRTKEHAFRYFQELCQKDENDFAKYPQDYSMFYLGSFDDVSCSFSLETAPVSLALAVEYAGRDSSSACKEFENSE